jgi:RHS repeat-associated protein
MNGVAGKVGYTGHADDAESGLTYAQARYYDPVVGRFLSPDPVRLADDFNLYAYVGNNPINATDPTGLYDSRDFVHQLASMAKNAVFWPAEALQRVLAKDNPVAVHSIAEAKDIATVYSATALPAMLPEASATRAVGDSVESRATTPSPVTSRYSRSDYKVRSSSQAATNARAVGQGQPCSGCGTTMQSGTPNAPWAQHEPPLSEFHYEHGGASMSAAEKKTYANSPEAYNGSNCAMCQRSEGRTQRDYVRRMNDELGL